MAYTTLAAWDFRGAGSASAKRDAVIGSYTLTESGSPDWGTDGVDLSGSTSDKLLLTLPSELKPGKPWMLVS